MLPCKPAGAGCHFLMENNITGLVSKTADSRKGHGARTSEGMLCLAGTDTQVTRMALPPLTPPPHQARCFRVPFKAMLFVLELQKHTFWGVSLTQQCTNCQDSCSWPAKHGSRVVSAICLPPPWKEKAGTGLIPTTPCTSCSLDEIRRSLFSPSTWL